LIIGRINDMKKQKIVTIGGGTGSFTLLSGLKNYPVEISAIVSMADDGGSTGVLRDELGVLPPGDVRQCLVALSESSAVMRELFNYRYASGGLAGHSFGNIFISTLEKISGNFNEAINEAGQILRISGRVIPVTLTNTKLVAKLENGKIIVGQQKIDEANLANLKQLKLRPRAIANPEAIRAIKQADKIVINPGNFYESILPNFLVSGISRSIKKSRAKKIFVCNLMTKAGHTDNFSVVDYLEVLEIYLGGNVIDYVIYNNKKPSDALIKKYSFEGEHLVRVSKLKLYPKVKFISAKLLANKLPKMQKGDKLKRTLIRHDSEKLAKLIYEIK